MINDDLIAKLKEANPGAELHTIENDTVGVEVVVKVPSDAEWRRFRSQQSDDQQKSIALRGLVLACVKYPPTDQFSAAVAAHPGIVETIGSKLVDIAGVSMATISRKL